MFARVLTASQPAPAAAFVAAPCESPAPRMTCGTVAVPRDADDPSAGTFRLAIVRIETASSDRHADPVVYLAGGPGAPLTSKAALLASHEAAIVVPDRDLILVDQRGAGRSEPALCPSLAARQLDIFAAGDAQPVLLDRWRASFADCRREMARAGLRLEWFGTRITADDIDRVRQALGIERWNVYALSYGTEVATTMLALHPQSLRAVVLDSVFLPEPVPMSLEQSFGAALDSLFATCERQAPCRAAHPDLRSTYAEAVRALDAAPLHVTLAPGVEPPLMAVGGELFRLIVNQTLYSRPAMAALPAFIAAARDRDSAAMADLVSRAARTYRTMAIGDMAAVECRDRPGWHDASEAPAVSAYVPGLCQGWGPTGPAPLLPADTGVPTLVLSGAIDPITPPVFARHAVAALGPRATLVEFAQVGHGAQQATPCGERVVTAFIRDPAAALPVACAGAIAPVTFR